MYVKGQRRFDKMFVFNRANLSDYNDNERATTFRQARVALKPFQAQLGVRLTF